MMRQTQNIGAVTLILMAICSHLAALAAESEGVNWPIFRGPHASGIAENYPTPTEWNIEESKHIKWKTPIPGLGHSSPVIWGDPIFLTRAISGQQYELFS